MTGSRRRTSALALAVVCVALDARDGAGAIAASSAESSQLVAAGRRLFEGRVPLANAGPACGSCHAIAGLPFPNGGVLGPDLSGIVERLGPDGTTVTLQTLFFPTMLPLYERRPLTAAEQQALRAFLEQATGSSGRARDTLVLGSLALLGLLLLLAGTGLVWRDRLRGVRAPLVARASGGARP